MYGQSTRWSIHERNSIHPDDIMKWWRHQTETFSALQALCAGNSRVSGEFPSQRPVTRSFDIFFELRPNKRLSKQSWGWWFESPLHSLWRQWNDMKDYFTLSAIRAWKCLRLNWIPVKEVQQWETSTIYMFIEWANGSTNSGIASDLRRLNAHVTSV